MKAKYRKVKQTDTSVPLSILAMSISLALSTDHGCSARPAGQAWVSGVIMMPQNHNVQNAYTDVPIFLAQKNVTVSIFIRYMLIQYSAFKKIIVLLVYETFVQRRNNYSD